MIGKKINQLATELAPVSTDLTIIGDPTTGVSKKITLAQLGAIFSGAVSFYTNLAGFPATGDINVIYCAKDTQKLYLWSGSAYVEVFPSQALLDTYQLRSEKGNANGYASLDSQGKVPISQLPSSIMEYKGTWNASTNTPTLANGTGDTGDVYICNVAGTVNFGAGAITFAVGDYVIYSGTIWQRSSGAVGTVTSVAASITGDSVTISGSPVTTSGTLAFAFAGNSTQYINGAGNLVTFPGVINEAQNLITEVYNKTGATLTKGTVVYINGGQGNLPTVTKALATGDSTSAQTYGIVQADITNNNNGFVVVAGRLTDIDTQAYANGTQLYLSSTTAGAYTSTKQYAPAHLVYIGIIVRSHPTQGVIEVKIQNGYEMDELHNVAAQSPDNNDILQYKTATSLWTKVAGTTSNIAEGSNLYYTDARSRAAISLTTTGSSGAASYNNTTGVLNIPNYGSALTGYVPYTGATANVNLGTYDLFSKSVFIEGSGSFQAGLLMKQNNGYNFVTGAYTQIVPNGINDLDIVHNQANTTRRRYSLSVAILQDGDSFQYLLPRLSGTFAMTSQLTGGTVTSVGLSSATSGVTIGSTPITTSGTITLAIATASGSQQGLLSSTDWTTFNNKQSALTNPVTGTGTTNYLPKFTGTSTIGNSQIFDNGTNVGIGTTSNLSGKLTVNGGFAIGNGWGTSGATLEASTGATGADGATIEVSYWGTSSYGSLFLKTGNAIRATLTSSGNLGLGVTPSAWSGTNVKAFQFGNSGALANSGTFGTILFNNSYYNSGYKYITTAATSAYVLDGSTHIWYQAPSGTAGNAISFTQAMTLNASGNLSIGNTNDTYKLDVTGTGRFTGALTGTSATFSDLVTTTSVFRITQASVARGGLYTYNQVVGSGTDYSVGLYSEAEAFIATGGTSTKRLTIASTGAATFSSSVTAGGTIFASAGGGQIQISGGSTLSGIFQGTGTNNLFIGDWNTATKGITINVSSGNVGIGTTSPTGRLMLYQSTAGNVFQNIVSNQGGSTQVGINFSPSMTDGEVAANPAQASIYATDSNFGANIIFANKTTGAVGNSLTERMRITSGGNVLIGTTSNASGAPTFHIQNKSGAVANIAGWNFGGTTTAENGNNNLLTSGAYYNGSSMVATQTVSTGYQQYSGVHVWYTDSGLTPGNAYSNTERMRITSDGAVGVGNASPSSYGSGYANLWVGSSGKAGYLSVSNGSVNLELNADGNGVVRTRSNHNLIFGTNETERMRITSGGQVNINSTQTNYRFYIQDSAANWTSVWENTAASAQGLLIRLTGGSAGVYYGAYDGGAYKFYINGSGVVNSTSTSITAISDITLKENIRDLETGLNEVMKLKPRRFDWKDETKLEKNVAGFIAQELQDVLPDLVYDYKYNDKETKKSIKMGDILPTLVKAIQEQQAQINELKSQLNK